MDCTWGVTRKGPKWMGVAPLRADMVLVVVDMGRWKMEGEQEIDKILSWLSRQWISY
jgi:hypothetical protein